MSTKQRVTVSELRRDLPKVLHRVIAQGESFLVMKNGMPFAVLSPVTDPEVNRILDEKLNDGVGAAVPVDSVVEGVLTAKASGP